MAVPGLDPGISPGHPDTVNLGVFQIEITGTRPVMTNEQECRKRQRKSPA
jgi:hypothetical protein